jgi:arylsulfatase A-like enzyme
MRMVEWVVRLRVTFGIQTHCGKTGAAVHGRKNPEFRLEPVRRWVINSLNRLLMLMKRFLTLFALILITWPAVAAPAPRPNIVLIIADDMAWDDCGVYGNRAVRTPNLDRLTREGMRFDRAFLTCSSCSPSRASILTGRYPHATGAQELHWPLPKEQVTFSEKLKASGYWTAAAGKWHLGEDVKNRFDVVKEAGTAGFTLPTGKDAGKAKMTTKEDPSGCAEWVATLQQRPKDKPFFLWFAALDPHRDYEANSIAQPHRPEDVIVPPYLPDAPDTRKDLALYYDEITRLDDYVGKVLAELDAQGVAENTLVIFMSDNGRPFPRCKTTVLDSGVRTPFFVRWPARIKPGSISPSIISSVDIAPTLLELAGLKAAPTFQGVSFAKLFTQPTAKVRDYAFSEHNWHDFQAHERAARGERFRYVRNTFPELTLNPPADAVRSLTFMEMLRLRDHDRLTPAQMEVFRKPRPTEELFDLETDPFELRNLAGDPKYAGELRKLRRALDRWVKETKDFVPKEPSPDEFDRESGAPLPTRQRPRLPKSPDRTF